MITVIIFFVLTVISAWAGLTKVGYIPNFLNIEILCPEVDDSWIDLFDPIKSDDSFDSMNIPMPMKPVIYLYPETIQDIEIVLDYKGEIIADYPNYDENIKGWSVTAHPDGRIISHTDNQEYSYLFWEGKGEDNIDWNLSQGFVVKGENVKEFLQEKLSILGLTPKEYNEFIVYWYPLMQNNEYNLIHFAGEQYIKTAPLTITPEPDSIIRVFMVYKSLEEMVQIEEQELITPERGGFTVIEWGGTVVK